MQKNFSGLSGLGFVFQEYNLLDTLTVYENIALALTIKQIPKRTIKQTIIDLADKLGISEILNKFPYEISGGQRQRCACVRAIAANPSLILADEPTGALDSHSAFSHFITSPFRYCLGHADKITQTPGLPMEMTDHHIWVRAICRCENADGLFNFFCSNF